MRPNLIQTYLNNMPAVQPDKKDRNLDIEYVLSNRTFIKPLPSKGHLVNRGILSAPSTVAKSLAYDAKSLGKSLTGKANDHELGKVNDIGMKVGGLMIAAYLMTRKQAPLAKAMELVGFASFFAAMSIWPKVALQWPAQLIHGFNIRQKYEDSFGREKMFFQDPQYLPWSLYSDQKINKIGDWMGVPKDMNNRRDFIQEKMKKVAVQNNTMWMLTAGFATPVLSALICNACEKPVKSYLGNLRAKKADNLLSNVSSASAKFKDLSSVRALDDILTANRGKELTPELVKKIKDILSNGFDSVTAQAVRDDLDDILNLNNKKFVMSDNVAERIIENTRVLLDKTLSAAEIDEFLPDKAAIKAILNKFSSQMSDVDVKKALASIGTEIRKNIQKYNSAHSDNPLNEKLIINKLFNVKSSDNPIAQALHSKSNSCLTPEVIKNLKTISDIFTDFKAKNAVLDEYVYLKSAAAPETVIANTWNDITGSLPKLFNISDKEIADTRYDRKMVGKLLREKIENIVSTENGEYEKIVQALRDKITLLDSKMEALNTSSSGSYKSTVNSIFEQFPQLLDEKGIKMPLTVNRLNGSFGSAKNIQLSFVSNRLLGIRSSLYRLLNTLDFYKRIADAGQIPEAHTAALHKFMPREIKEEVVEMAKSLSVEGTTSDFITKFYKTRNPKPNLQDLDNIKVEAGKVKNKYLGKAVEGGKVDIPQDKNFFKEVVKLLYENQLHQKTSELISSGSIANELSDYRRDFIREIGDAEYFFKSFHIVNGQNKNAKSYKQFLLMGMAPDQMFSTTMKEMFNTKKWLKMFGGFGAGLLGITVLSQFFFGKMKAPEVKKND